MTRHTLHNPLLLPELFHLILDFLDAPNSVHPRTLKSITCITAHEPSRAARKALYALAQTCRALSEPCLDRLWRSLDSLVPLIRCFAEVMDADTAMTLPSPAEWAIIRRYTVRVRELRITEAPGTALSLLFLQCVIIRSLLDRTNSKPYYLFPNLRVLIWKPFVDFGVTPLLEGLLAPGLVSLDITLEGEVDTPSPLFESFALLCPNLKTLRWDFGSDLYEPVLHVLDALSSSIVRLGKLESLEFFAPMDPCTLREVILSPCFKTLGIGLDHHLSEVEYIDITPVDTPFPSVEKIGLEIGNLHFLTSLLRPHHQQFRHIEVKLHSEEHRPLVQPIHSFFAVLATPQRIKTLQSLKFVLHTDYLREDYGVQDAWNLEEYPTHYCLTYETLSPLASFHSLRELYIALHNQISIDDDELATLARCWPSLQVLQLNCRAGGWPWAPGKCATLRGLLALIRACPHLWSLFLPLDARNVTMDASPDVRSTVLFCVTFPDAYIHDARAVAAFLRRHCPSVKRVHTVPAWGYEFALRGGDVDYGYVAACRRLWKDVEALL